MNKLLLTLILVLGATRNYSQTGAQIGLSTLPVLDYLNAYPQNTIGGIALSGNFGCFFTKDVAFGVSPFMAVAKNDYNSPAFSSENDLLVYGLNTYLRYYFLNGKRHRLYSLCAAGVSHIMISSTSSGRPSWDKHVFTDGAISVMGGTGINYYLTGNFALELNVTYVALVNVFLSPPQIYFHTVAPTAGFQFFIDTRPSNQSR